MRRPSLASHLWWLALPLAGFLGAVVLELTDGRSDGEIESLSEAHFLGDAKLRRTVGTWGESAAAIEPLGRDGLSLEMLIRDREWAEVRSIESVERYRDVSHETLLRFDGGPAIRGSYRVRGRTSLARAFELGVPERTNFHVRFGRALPFTPTLGLDRFYLQNMMFDRHHYKMRIANVLLADAGLFPCHNQLVDLRVNGRLLGVFLLVERPQDAILRTHSEVDSIYRRLSTTELSFAEIYRRGHGRGATLVARLTRAITELRGAPLVAELEEILDLDGYLRWLAFNSLVRNGDSFDEVFFYLAGTAVEPGRRLRVMGWDYDDLWSKPAHPEDVLDDPLLFASAGDLDRRIQEEPLLYGRFRRVYRRLLAEELTPVRISAVAGTVAGELDELESGFDGAEDETFRRRRELAIRHFEKSVLARRERLMSVLGESDV
jgi:hypothetical protein